MPCLAESNEYDEAQSGIFIHPYPAASFRAAGAEHKKKMSLATISSISMRTRFSSLVILPHSRGFMTSLIRWFSLGKGI